MKQGFTLIEMTMVLLIVGLLVGSFVIPLGAQIDINNIKSTDQRLAQIREALLGYAARNRRLPCSASNATTGIEDSATCNDEKFLPWAVLGVDGKDGWGNTYRYRVDTKHTAIGAYNATIPAPADEIEVKNKLDTTTYIKNAIAIIYSYGKNKQPDALNIPIILLDPDSKTYAQDDFAPNNFDDRLVWLSDNELVSRLAAAGFRIK
jgi:prepilin-type N-terminal cleavage/methylation domain-containing protein